MFQEMSSVDKATAVPFNEPSLVNTHTHKLIHKHTYCIECVCLSEPLSTVPVVPNEKRTNEGQRGDETTGTWLCRWGNDETRIREGRRQ